MTTIDKKVNATIKNNEASIGKGGKIQAYESASNQFKNLVSKGLVKERGNNLLSTAEKHSKVKVWFNV
jgi:hypothetical protein